MLFSEEWLRHYINPNLDTDQLTEAMTMAGLEVEEVTTYAPPFTGVVVAHVVDCVDHENSDHLHVCKVDVGTGELLQIVCGAPNVKTGVKVPCAVIGAELPGNFKIKKTKLRGVESQGMLCSARELGTSEDHSGLWILPEDAPIGMNIREYAGLDDKCIEIKLTPNRGDALSVLGVARDVHAITGAQLNQPDMTPVAATCDCKKTVRVENTDLCGRFTGRVIRGLNPSAPTPDWMRARLEKSGQRSISALVDISNYVMLELGRPTHFFDLSKISGDIVVRWAKEGETIKLLNAKTVELDPYFGVVADDNGPQAIAGIMGGDADSISDDTTDIFIEAAFWQQSAIQGRCRRLNFSTDAAHRFERGVDYGSNAQHMEYVTRLVLDICGTSETKVGPVDDQVLALPETRVVRMRPARCNKIVGIDIPESFMAEAFDRLGFSYTRDGSDFVVTAPSYRFDIEIEEDLIEEVARLYGYDRLPDRPPMARVAMRNHLESTRTKHGLRLLTAQLGYQELINFSFVQPQWEKDFAGNDKPIELLNPIASQLSVMRTQLIAGLVDILRFNLNRKTDNVRVFELGRVFIPNDQVQEGPFAVQGIDQPMHLAGLAYGSANEDRWNMDKRNVDFYDVKGDVERLVAPRKATFEVAQHPALHPGRSARVVVDGQVIGWLGELHPKVCRAYDLPKAPVVFELDVEGLLARPVPCARAVSKFQPLHRDLSLNVPTTVSYQSIVDCVMQLRRTSIWGSIIESFELFDVYRAENATTQSMAFRLTLSTLGDEAISEDQVEMLTQEILSKLGELGAQLRA